MRRIFTIVGAGVAALALLVGCAVTPTPTTTTTTLPPTELELTALSTDSGHVDLGEPVSIKLKEPVGAEGNWVLDRDGLLAGMTFDPSSGVISGTPTDASIWFLRVHFELTGGSPDDVLPFYEVVGAVMEDTPSPQPPPPGTFHPNTAGLDIEVRDYSAGNFWTQQTDGSLSVPRSTSLTQLGFRVPEREYEFKAGSYFPAIEGSDCSALQLSVPSSAIEANPVDTIAVPGAAPGSECEGNVGITKRHFAVAEKTGSGSLRIHMFGADAATELWSTEVPGVDSLPYGSWVIADDGSTVAFVASWVGYVVTDSGSQVVDLPGEYPERWCDLASDDNWRAGSDVSHAPLGCSHADGTVSAGYIDLLTGTSVMHVLPPELDGSYDQDEMVRDWVMYKSPSWVDGAYAGEKYWLVNFSTGEAQLFYEYSGAIEPSVTFYIYPQSGLAT